MDRTVLLQEIGERIRQVRKTQGLTQKDFAQQIGISNTHLSELEIGQASARAEFLAGLEKVFAVDLHWLITGKQTIVANAMKSIEDIEQSKERLKVMQNLLQTMQYLVSEELKLYP